MAVSMLMYGKALISAFSADIDIPAGTIKCMLVTSTYTPDQDAHQFKSSVTGEATGTGYTAGGVTLTSKSLAYAASTNTFTIDAADVSWTSSTITARYAVIYQDTGTSSTSPLIGYVDFGADMSSSASTFALTWDAAGMFSGTVS